MKTDEMIVIFAALVLLALFVKVLFDFGACHNKNGEYRHGVCIVVLKSNGSVNQVRK